MRASPNLDQRVLVVLGLPGAPRQFLLAQRILPGVELTIAWLERLHLRFFSAATEKSSAPFKTTKCDPMKGKKPTKNGVGTARLPLDELDGGAGCVVHEKHGGVTRLVLLELHLDRCLHHVAVHVQTTVLQFHTLRFENCKFFSKFVDEREGTCAAEKSISISSHERSQQERKQSQHPTPANPANAPVMGSTGGGGILAFATAVVKSSRGVPAQALSLIVSSMQMGGGVSHWHQILASAQLLHDPA